MAVRRKLTDNLRRIERRIANAAGRAGRDPAAIKLVVVTKYATLDVIHTLLEIGVRDIGENRGLELTKRAAAVHEWLTRRRRDDTAPDEPQWHMIGHLQRNKVKPLLPHVDMIHSVDSLRLAEEIDAQATKLGRVIPVLLEVNASDEPAKHGIAVAAASHVAEQLLTLPHIEVRGLMTMAPLTDDDSRIRWTFDRTRELFEEIVDSRQAGPQFRELSMGMSNDFELAIERGATCVRIGSALFEGIDLGAPLAEPVES